MDDFEIRSSRAIFDGVVVRLRVDTVSMPGGGVAEREVVDHDLAVAVVALDDRGRVALIEQYRHPLGRRLWELPAGLMDVDGESALSAAQRELAEETGLAADHWAVLVDVAVSPGFTTEAMRVFLARDVRLIGRQGEIAGEEADLRLVWVPLSEARDAVLAGRIVNAAAVSGILAADRALADALPLRPADVPWNDGPALVAADRPARGRDRTW